MRPLVDRDILAGLLFAAIGVAGLILSVDYEPGTLGEMGPGLMPRIVCWALVALGLIIAVKGAIAPTAALEIGGIIPFLLIIGSLAIFAFLVDRIGLALSAAGIVFIVSRAEVDSRLREGLILAICLSVASCLLFVTILGLPLSITPR